LQHKGLALCQFGAPARTARERDLPVPHRLGRIEQAGELTSSGVISSQASTRGAGPSR
jgi:hypothetical protein